MNTSVFLKGLDQAFASRQHATIARYLDEHLAKAEQQHDTPAMITVLNEMTGYYRSVSRYNEAITSGERAVELMRLLGAVDSSAFGTTMLNLATAYNASGNSFAALELYEQVLAIYLKHLPYNHMSFAALYNNMGSLYLGRGEDGKALQVLQKAMPILARHRGVYGESATIYTNLAQALFRLHKREEALQVLNTAMRIFEGNPVRRDPHYAAALAASGQMYYAMHEYTSAAKAYEAAVRYTKDCYGENKDFATACENCALALEALGDTVKSAAYKEQGRAARQGLKQAGANTTKSSPQDLGTVAEDKPVLRHTTFDEHKDDFMGTMLHEVDKLLNQSFKEANRHSVEPSVSEVATLNVQMQAHTKGLELARAYYETHGKGMINNFFPAYSGRIAVGLVGEGSECFGFDDAISADHDFGPAFCMWLTSEDYQSIGHDLQKAYTQLPQIFRGVKVHQENIYSSGRVGVQCVDSFYRSRIGRPDAHLGMLDWLRLPESRLAAATNGAVFHDPLGDFSRIREQLLSFYPEDVRIKKIAARAFLMGQSGQYNYGRSMSRKDGVAAILSLQEFIKQTCSMVFLLNKKYAPFYKWLHRGLQQLPVLSKVADLLDELAGTCSQVKYWQGKDAWTLAHSINMKDQNVRIMEQVCHLIRQQLYDDGLSVCQDDFLSNHVEAISNNITDSAIRALPHLEA